MKIRKCVVDKCKRNPWQDVGFVQKSVPVCFAAHKNTSDISRTVQSQCKFFMNLWELSSFKQHFSNFSKICSRPEDRSSHITKHQTWKDVLTSQGTKYNLYKTFILYQPAWDREWSLESFKVSQLKETKLAATSPNTRYQLLRIKSGMMEALWH